jgi:cysteine synthase A/cysteine synthase B
VLRHEAIHEFRRGMLLLLSCHTAGRSHVELLTEAPTGLGSDPARRRYEDVRDLLPDRHNPTPLVRVRGALSDPSTRLYLKLEWLNPFGSIKDRTAAYLLAGLRERGELAGREIVEASSGNTAIALAALAALSGTRLTVTIPDGVPEEKQVLLRMLGAEVWSTPDDLCPVDHPKDGAIALARSLAESAGGERFVMPNQYENPDNVRAHYETTGPEIWEQTDGQVKAFFAGFGTCGTITGVGRYLKEQDPSIQVIAIEPQTGHRLPGLKSFGEAKEPGILDWDVIDHVVRVDDEPAYAVTKDLFRKDGLMVGPSTGAIVHAADQMDIEGIAVGVSPDSGLKYTSYFADLLGEEGLPQ